MSFLLALVKEVYSLILHGGEDFLWERGATPLSQPAWPLGGAAAYLLAVQLLPLALKQPLKVPTTLVCGHNLLLSVGSAVMFAGCVSAAREVYSRSGSLDFLFCTAVGTQPGGRIFFWSYLYYLSKYVEFIDTLLLLLKRKPASLLHVFHHALVVVMAWLWVDQAQSMQFPGLLANTAVHVVMYYYYFLTALGVKPWWKKYITSMQLVQFSVSFVCLLPFFLIKSSKEAPDGCAGMEALVFNAVFNFCLLLLFLQFYLATYKAGGKQARKQK